MVLLVALMLSSLAALGAFLITYNEYAHHYETRRKPLKLALEAAFAAFALFLLLGALVSLLIVRLG